MLKTTHFHSHCIHTNLDFWDYIALGHFCLCVCSCVVLNCCFRACTGCLWEVFSLGFFLVHSLALGRMLLWIQLGRWCLEWWWLCLTVWPCLWVPSSNVQGFWTLAMFGIRKENSPCVRQQGALDFLPPWVVWPVICFLGLSGNAI